MFFARENLNRKNLRMATKQQPSQVEPLHPGLPKRQHTPNPDTASRIAAQLHTAHHFKYPHLMLGIRDVLNTLVLLGSLLIIAALSFETFYDTHGYYFHLYLKIQLWVCIVFMADFLYRLYLSEHKNVSCGVILSFCWCRSPSSTSLNTALEPSPTKPITCCDLCLWYGAGTDWPLWSAGSPETASPT